jgi:large subunit ribosomal protein L24
MANKQRKYRKMEKRVPHKIKLKIGDPVVVISGKDKGQTGTIRSLNRKKGIVTIDGVNLIKKTKRKSQEMPQGDIVELPGPIHVSNVMYYHSKIGAGVRIGYKIDENGKKIRYNHKHEIELD